MHEFRCYERLKAKAERSTRLTDTGFHWGLEHLKTETRLIGERFVSEMFEYLIMKSFHLLGIEKARVKEKTYK